MAEKTEEYEGRLMQTYNKVVEPYIKARQEKRVFGNLFDESRKNALARVYNPKADPKSDRYQG